MEREGEIWSGGCTDNLRGLLGIRRMNRVPNARIKEICEVKKGLDERIEEGILR